MTKIIQLVNIQVMMLGKLDTHTQKNELDHYLMLYTKIN